MHIGRQNIYINKNPFGLNTYLYNTKWGTRSGCGENCKIYDTIIGNYTEIAWNVSIGPYDHFFKNFTIYSFLNLYNNEQLKRMQSKIFNGYRCKIGNDVWVGCYSIIMEGVEIGNGAVVAANSVVTKSVPPYAIVGGSPAKFLKWRFSVEQIQQLETVKWYNLSEDDILNRKEEFQNIVNFDINEVKYSRKENLKIK